MQPQSKPQPGTGQTQTAVSSAQARYLQLLDKLHSDGHLTTEGRAQIVAALHEHFPGMFPFVQQ